MSWKCWHGVEHLLGRAREYEERMEVDVGVEGYLIF
jgi:hypothetical protein